MEQRKESDAAPPASVWVDALSQPYGRYGAGSGDGASVHPRGRTSTRSDVARNGAEKGQAGEGAAAAIKGRPIKKRLSRDVG